MEGMGGISENWYQGVSRDFQGTGANIRLW